MEKKGCTLCPRMCGADRINTVGVCGCTDKIKIAKYMLHKWEEPVISVGNGSGAIFFSGCPLKCVYCQNIDISRGNIGYEVTEKDLGEIMLRLQSEGAANINLVTPTHFSSGIRNAIDQIRDKLKIPVVYNTSGYENKEEILKMAGYVDVFLTDMKYYSSEYSKKYSFAPDYFERATEALYAMLEICPEVKMNGDGAMTGGVIVRHLVLPGLRRDSLRLLEEMANRFDVRQLKLSLMSQYTPDFCPDEYRELKRRLTTFEYESVLERATELGYEGFAQDPSSAKAKYTPNFKENEDNLL